MDRQQTATKLALEALGLSIKLDSFDDRLVVQKSVYLAQAAGIQLGYHFQWYLRGPYSPLLTKDAFAIAAESSHHQDSPRWQLDVTSTRRLTDLKSLIPPAGSTRARHLELLASVLFLINEGQVERQNLLEIAATLKRYNKDYSSNEISVALQELEKHALIKASSN